MAPEVRRERMQAAREQWAELIPVEHRAEFHRLLGEADGLIAAGWQLRKTAWEIAKRHQEVQP
jgi:hypothetical protein